MAMASNGSGQAKGRRLTKAWWAGWHDYVAGRNYPRLYNAWGKGDQLNYETGRLWAANVQSAKLVDLHPLLAPPSNETTRRLCYRSLQMLGNPVPDETSRAGAAR